MSDDLAYVCDRHLNSVHITDLAISLHTRFQHYHWITEAFGYRMLQPEDRALIEARALRAARVANRPVHVFREVVDHLRDQNIVLPGYTYLQDVVRRALAFERDRLATALTRAMSADDKRKLDALLRDDAGLHAVTSIKHHPRNFSHQQLLIEIERGQHLRPLYSVAQRIIAETGLSEQSVKFYASLVDYYTAYKLKRLSRPMTRLYLLCFVQDRYQGLSDHLISGLCALVRRYANEVTAQAQDAALRFRREANADIDRGVKVLSLFGDPLIDDQDRCRAHGRDLQHDPRPVIQHRRQSHSLGDTQRRQ